MASVRYGSLIVYMAGTLGGHVFKRNGNTGVLMTKPNGKGLPLLFRPELMSVFKENAEQFRQLVASDQAGYNALGQRLPLQDWEGGQDRLTGAGFVNKTFTTQQQLGVTVLAAPSDYVNAVTTPQLVLMAFDTFTELITFSAVPEGLGAFTEWFYSEKEKTAPFVELSELRSIGIVPFNPTFNAASYQLFNNAIGPLIPGQQFWMGWRFINASGAKGGVSSLLATVFPA